MRDGYYGAPPPRDHNLPPGALLDVETLTQILEQLGIDWADKRAAAEALDDATKSVLGAALLECDGKTTGEREARARNTASFKGHLDAVRDAKREAYRAHIRYEVQKTRIELRRSNSATERALAQIR